MHQLANCSRNEHTPFALKEIILLEKSIKTQADQTEVEYWISVLKKRDFDMKDLIDLYDKARTTLTVQLCKLGRLCLYDSII